MTIRKKNRNADQYIKFFILFCFAISCSDWEKDPTEIIKTKIEEEPTIILRQTNFPKNVSSLSMLDGYSYLAGTNDGVFYKSRDSGKSWSKIMEMKEKAKILNFNHNEYHPEYILASTQKGGYLSSDHGSTWNEVLPAQNREKMYHKVTIGYFKDFFFSSFSFYGYNGTVNYFSTTNRGVEWITENIELPIPNAVLEYYKKDDVYLCNGDSGSAIVIKGSSVKPLVYKENMELSSFLFLETKKYYLAGSKKGVLLSSNSGNTWNSYISDCQVNSLSNYQNKGTNTQEQLYAGTSNGLYVSVNGGLSWSKIDLFENNKPVTKTYIFINRLYFTNSDGDTFYFVVPDESKNSLFIPVQELPLNNARCENFPVLKWIETGQFNGASYKLEISKDITFKEIVVDTLTKLTYYKTSFNRSGEKYFWRLRSEKIWGKSGWSETYCFTLK